MKPNITIRPARQADIPGVLDLLLQVLQVHAQGRPDIFKPSGTKYSAEELMDIFSDESRPVFVATQADRVVGYAFCIFQNHVDHPVFVDSKSLYIDDLCVDGSCRGQHIGKALYEHVLSFARQAGCYNVTLNVWSANAPAMAFYQNMGMQPQKMTMETIL